MKRTVTALYDTQAQAERVRDALRAAGLCDDVVVHDRDAGEARGHRSLGDWLSDLFGGHSDSHVYAEGLRRGHVLLTAKVDELNETRAAEIMDTEAPVDLSAAETKWREDGWESGAVEPRHSHKVPADAAAYGAGQSRGPYAPTAGSGIRTYTL